MLFVFAILLVLLAVAGVAVLVKRRIDRDLIDSGQPKNLMETRLRPLFEAEEEEVRAAEAVEAVLIDDGRENKLAKLAEFRQTWGAQPTRRETAGLLFAASECGDAGVYSKVVRDVLREFRAGRIDGLSSTHLADLVETHLWLLPAAEKMSGEGFGIKEEVAELRAGK